MANQNSFEVGQAVRISAPTNFYNGREGVVRSITPLAGILIMQVAIKNKTGSHILVTVAVDAVEGI